MLNRILAALGLYDSDAPDAPPIDVATFVVQVVPLLQAIPPK